MYGELCVRCKGARKLCGQSRCTLLDRMSAKLPTVVVGKELFGPSPPAVFVGRYGYPNVRLGPLLPAQDDMDVTGLGTPSEWFGQPVEEIVIKRASLVRTANESDVRSPAYAPRTVKRIDRPLTEAEITDILPPQVETTDPTVFRAAAQRKFRKLLDVTQEVSMSVRSVDTEVKLSRNVGPLTPRPAVDPFAAPHGPTVAVEKAKLAQNPSVPRKVDHIVSDDHCPAVTGMLEMDAAGVDFSQIQRVLSVGLLGRSLDRKLVPTRWSITATDDTLSKAIVNDIKVHSSIDKYELYRASYVGNHFFIILMPREWCFEMLECWCPGAFWTGDSPTILHDHEYFKGRTTYASQITGAYYSARLSVARHLAKRRRQAGVLIYREITEDYWAPLGVWVIRETVREAMRSKPLIIEDLPSAAKKVDERIRNKGWYGVSELYKNTLSQKRLTEF